MRHVQLDRDQPLGHHRLLGILLDEKNAGLEMPIVLTGPAGSAAYFEALLEFIGATLGEKALRHFTLIVDDPDRVAAEANAVIAQVAKSRTAARESFCFNWPMQIADILQQPFEATHKSMSMLDLGMDQPIVQRAANLRRAFSGIVAGNVRAEGVALVRRYGPFEITGDQRIAQALDSLLRGFVEQKRMKLSDPHGYEPCYRVVA